MAKPSKTQTRTRKALSLTTQSAAFFLPIILAASYLNAGPTCCNGPCPPPPGPCDSYDAAAAIVSSSGAGRLEGTFGVENGSASYRIPLDVPAGVNGLAPELALEYKSGTTGGVVGVGWQLSGLNGIRRCRPTIAQDGEAGGVSGDTDDKFCLDGQRLVVVAGTYGASNAEYRLEEDTNIRVFSRGSTHGSAPAYFEVHHPNGHRAYYGVYGFNGSAGVDRVSGLTGSTVRWEWLVARIEDQYGNSIEYEYTDPTEPDRPVLLNIRYGNRRINLSYGFRSDFHNVYRAGIAFREFSRLKTVSVYSTGKDGSEALGWTYELTYDYSPSTERSRLISATKCDHAGQCLPPTHFTWSEQVEGFDVVEAGEGLSSTDDFNVGDWDGDGKTDVIYTGRDANDRQVWYVRLATHAGLGPATEVSFGDNYNWPAAQRTVFPADFDQDGRTDLLVRTHWGYNPEIDEHPTEWDYGWHFWSWNQGQFEIHPVSPWHEDGTRDFGVLPTDVYDYMWREYNYFFGPVPIAILDINGDGILDLLYAYRCDAGNWGDLCTARQGEPWSSHSNALGDEWNVLSARLGDGQGDFGPLLVVAGHSVQTGEIYPVQLDDDPGVEWLVAADENEFHREDYEWVSDWYRWDLRGFDYSDGFIRELFAVTSNARMWIGIGPYYQHGNHVLDANGDGLSEFLVEDWDLTTFVPPGLFSHHGIGWNWDAPSTVPNFYQTGYVYPAASSVYDYDGDGLDDLVNAPRNPGPQPTPTLNSTPHGIAVYRARDGVHQSVVQFPSLPSPTTTPGNRNMIHVGDFNGDGLQDLAYRTTDPPAAKPELMLLLRRGPHPDRIVLIEDGWGAKSKIEYAPLNDRDVYDTSRGSYPCDYPSRCIDRGGLVVSAYETSVSSAGMRRYEMEYRGARADLHGRGWIGFAEVTTHDLSADTHRTVFYDLDPLGGRYPLAKRPAWILTSTNLSDGTLHTRYEYRDYDYVESYQGSVYAVRDATRTTFEYEHKPPATPFNAVLLRQTETRLLNYDAYNYARRIEHTVGGGDATTIVRGVYNDPTNWILGLVTNEFTTSTTQLHGSATRTRAMTYTPQGALESMTQAPGSPLELTTTFDHDSLGRIEWVHEVSGGETRSTGFTYDATTGAYVETITNALGHEATQCTHPALGVVTKEVGINGLSTLRLYDGVGRLRSEAGPDGSAATFGYETGDITKPWSITVNGNDGSWSKVEHDLLGRPITEHYMVYEGSSSDEREVMVDQVWDALGRVAVRFEPRFDGGSSTAEFFYYDRLNRPTRRVSSELGTRDWEYDELKVIEKDQRNVSHIREYDVNGRLVRTHVDGPSDGSGEPTVFTYGPFGQLKTVTRGTAVTAYTHEPDRGFLKTITDSDGGYRTYDYYGFGEVRMMVDNGEPTLFFYDKLGRVTARNIFYDRETSTALYGYDETPTARGRLTSTIHDDIETEIIYNDKGLVGTTRVTVDGEVYELVDSYDDIGRLERTDYPTVGDGQRFSTVHRYTDQGYRYHIGTEQQGTAGSVYWQVWWLNPSRLPTTSLFGWDSFLGGQVFQGATYEPISDRPKTLTTTRLWEGVVQDLEYTWEPSGLLESRVDWQANRYEAFHHDDQRRLDYVYTASSDGTFERYYEYDMLGNLILYDGKVQEYTDPAHPHQLTKSGNDTSYQYDDGGRMTVGGGRLITYTTFDLPSSVTKDGITTEFRYDALNQRVVKESPNGKTVYVGDLYEKRVEDGETHHIHHVPGVAQVAWTETSVSGVYQKTTNYLVSDHLGSTSLIASGTDAAIAQRRQYTPFGRRMDLSGNVLPTGPPDEFRVGFTGHEHDDELNLINMGGRIYDPDTARMLSPDPFVSVPSDTQSWNPYSYVRNSPLIATDPTGFFEDHFREGGGAPVLINPSVVAPTPPRHLWDEITFGPASAAPRSPTPPSRSGLSGTAAGPGSPPMNEVTTRSSRGAPIHSPVESPRGIVQTFNGVAAGGLFSLGVLGAGGVLVTGATAALVAPFLPLLAIVGLATLSVGTISAFDSGAVDAVLEGNATEAEGFLFGGTVVGIGTLGVGAAAGAARGVAPVRATSAARGSGSTIRANKAAGDAFEAAIGAELRATHEVVAPQVTIRTPSGTRTRVDFVTRDGTSIGCVECKASATAPLTRNQAAAFPEIQQSGGVVMGKGKPGVPGGTVIPPRTQVRIRRP